MVYFLQAVDGGPIKIGFTERLSVRIKQLEATYAKPLALLRAIPGGRIEEHDIHRKFAHLRLDRTEQFRPEPELLDFIGCPLFASATPVVEAMEYVGPRGLASLKGGAKYAAWLDKLGKFVHLPTTLLIEHALREYAERHGFPDKQPER